MCVWSAWHPCPGRIHKSTRGVVEFSAAVKDSQQQHPACLSKEVFFSLEISRTGVVLRHQFSAEFNFAVVLVAFSRENPGGWCLRTRISSFLPTWRTNIPRAVVGICNHVPAEFFHTTPSLCRFIFRPHNVTFPRMGDSFARLFHARRYKHTRFERK